ncbi:VRR-NUC domain-containing protein [Microcella alkaliphila]|uniref:VRR-NUC domain-containing protein n=1 Tax=Microcella alkaliphila TaxID=279828 RepID=UPI001F5422D0|nr:VRR-NUC domain-containing protein [Microcella alkaliphila]
MPFTLGERKVFPDGLIRVRRGQKSWTALIEVKTSTNALEPTQLEDYLDVAREHGFDALLTISNEIPAAIGTHPTSVDKRKLRKVSLHHYSWSEILTAAVVQKEHRGVADPDQAWILGELIRYLEHPKSGALSFEDMGQSWVPIREAVAAGTLRTNDAGLPEVVSRFDALIRFAGLKLGRQLGSEVLPVLSRAESSDPRVRSSRMATELVKDGHVTAGLRIPGAISDLTVVADLRAGLVTAAFSVEAPKEGKPTTRINWLLRQLRSASDSLRIEAIPVRSSTGAAELLGTVRDNPALLVPESGREIKSFTVTKSVPMGSKRGTGRGSFIDSVVTVIEAAYGEIGQSIKAWAATPPKLRPTDAVETEPGIDRSLASAALSSQDNDD